MIPSEPSAEFTPSGFDNEFASPADYARLYRLRGIQVVPAFMPGEHKSWKRPLLDSWKDYQSALVDDATFGEWYGASGKYVTRPNMGVITGRASNNIFVIDLDHHKSLHAANWWNVLMVLHNNAMDLETVEQVTGGGGSQKLFRAPPDWTAPTNKTPIGVDIRGQGGFAMLAPSLHESGRHYEWLEGRSPDDIPVTMAPDWLLEAVEKLVAEYGGTTSSQRKSSNGTGKINTAHQDTYDGFGSQVDGREEYMRDLIWAAIVDWRRECPIKPSAGESLAKETEKYQAYERHVSPQSFHLYGVSKTEALDAEGRGPQLFHVKWDAAMRHWDDKVAVEARVRPPIEQKEVPALPVDPATGKTSLFEVLNVDQILAMADPHWLVDKLVVEQALGFIYGPPGCLKTFIALDMALSFTTGQPLWWNRGIQRKGAVVYISSEGQADLKFRLQAWEKHRGAKIAGTPFRLIRQSINFMDPRDVGKLLATVADIETETGPIAAVFVDTVSRVLPGAEENLQKDMSLFIAACDAVRQRFLATVFGLHHTSRNGNMRGSTVMPGAGDFIIEVRREPGAMSGSIYAFKIKAAEDGWEQPFKVTEVQLAGIVEHTSLMVDPVDVAPKVERGRGWPEPAVCREILSAIDDAWATGQPWCFASNSSRSAVTHMMKKWNLKRPIARDIMETWSAEGMITETVYSSKDHIKGFKKQFGF